MLCGESDKAVETDLSRGADPESNLMKCNEFAAIELNSPESAPKGAFGGKLLRFRAELRLEFERAPKCSTWNTGL